MTWGGLPNRPRRGALRSTTFALTYRQLRIVRQRQLCGFPAPQMREFFFRQKASTLAWNTERRGNANSRKRMPDIRRKNDNRLPPSEEKKFYFDAVRFGPRWTKKRGIACHVRVLVPLYDWRTLYVCWHFSVPFVRLTEVALVVCPTLVLHPPTRTFSRSHIGTNTTGVKERRHAQDATQFRRRSPPGEQPSAGANVG